MPYTREENIFRHFLFGDKTIQNCPKIDANHWYDNDLLLGKETKKKRLHVLEADIITIIKALICCLWVQRFYFLQEVFQMIDIGLVSVINNYKLHPFWHTLYKVKFDSGIS